MKKYKILVQMADEGFGTLREDYSGRGMYGDECVGLVTDDPENCIEEAASRGIRGAKYDSMGLKTIVYWENVKMS